MAINRKYNLPLRPYFTIMFISLLLISYLISVGLVYLIYNFLLKVTWTVPVFWSALFFVDLLSIVFGALSMWSGAYHLTKPIADLNEAVGQVAKGNYNQAIRRRESLRKGFPYANELDELAENFNRLTQELAQTENERKAFVSSVAHEFKTPLTGLSGIAELLQGGQLNREQQQEFLGLLQTETSRLSNLSQALLTLSRLENQTIVKQVQSFRLDEQLRQAMILVSEKWRDKQVDMQLTGMSIELRTDQQLLMEVWINLLDNAIKYSEDPVRLALEMTSDTESIKVSIRDWGIGMSSQEKKYAFERFYQANQTRKMEGNGLGLAIVEEIMLLLKGQITIVNLDEFEQGTEIIVTLPLIER